MTGGSAHLYNAPILVLGLGNTQLGDDGLGPIMVKELAERCPYAAGLADGGTEGLDLLGSIRGRQALVVVDALASGGKPGTVSVLEGADVLRFAAGRATTVQEGNAGELLATAAFLGDLPDHCSVIGVQPGRLDGGVGLSEEVWRSLPIALAQAQRVVDRMLIELAEPSCAPERNRPCA
jgi:hydrogenase maturation protease